MTLTKNQIEILKELMINSANKGNLATSAIVLENGKIIASTESLVATNNDTTAHSETMIIKEVGQLKKHNYTPGLTLITVVESCLMCMSAASQAGYKEVAYIIPASRYVEKIPFMTDIQNLDKHELASKFSEPFDLIHLEQYEDEFSEVFEKAMSHMLG